MNKKWVMLGALFLLLLSNSFALENVNDYNNYSSLDLRFQLLSNFTLAKQSARARIDMVSAELSFYPLAEKQTVRNVIVDADPKAQIAQSEKSVTYTWQNPSSELFTYKEEADIRISASPLLVRQKIAYPIAPMYNEYTQETEFIDLTPEIQEKARELTAGEDDLFLAVVKIAEWVENNIKYDLTTLTAPVVQKSSWVFQNREGVCDELTNLFISMVRSRGIPARYVTGLAYTNVGYKWGPHAWAEVFFPGVGWVPFDITYKQLGWVDPTHIRLKVSADSGEASVKYAWKALDTKFQSGGVSMRAEVTGKGSIVPKYVALSVRPLLNRVGPRSYVPLEVTIQNLQDAYLPLGLIVTKAQDLTEKNVKQIVLLPGQEQKVYWFMRVPQDLDPGFNYYSFVEVQDTFHDAAQTNVTYASSFKTYSLDDARKVVGGGEIEQSYARFVRAQCQYNEYAFSYEKIPIACTVSNEGEFPLYDLRVCLDKKCETVTIQDKQSRTFQYALADQALGLQQYSFLVENKDVRKIERVIMNIVANPDMVVNDFQVPERVAYADEFQVSFVMNVKAPVKDVTTYVNGRELVAIPSLLNSKKLIIKTQGSEYVREKRINLKITYKDRNDKEYAFTKAYPVQIADVPFFIRVLIYLRII